MKKGLLLLIITASLAAGCIKRNSSGVEVVKSAVVYINMSEFYPVGIDTLWVPPGDTSMAFAGTVAPSFPPSYTWASGDESIIKVLPDGVGPDVSARSRVIALGDSGQMTTVTVTDADNGGTCTIVAKVIKWAEPLDFTYIGRFGRNLYFTSTNMENWPSALNRCIWNHGHLAAVQSAEENAFLATVPVALDTLIWLGASSVLPPDTEYWTWDATEWVSGEPIVYKNWKSGNPNGANRWEKYEYMAMNQDGKWENIENKILPYVLEIEN